MPRTPINYDALFLDGLLNLGKGEAAKAIRVFEYLSNTYRQNPQVRYHLARAYLLYAKSAGAAESRTAVETAESRLDEAVKLNPRFEEAILLLAELKIRKGVPAPAVDLLVPLIKERPQSAQAHYLLATAYLQQQKRDEALAVYRQMTESFPKDPQPPFLVGSMLLAEGQQADARKAFEKSVEISPDYLPPVEKLVDLDIAEQQYAAALARVEKHIEKNPKLAQAWALKGKIYFAQRDFTHAESDLLKAVELDPKLEPAYLLLGQLYVASNRQQEAIAKLSAFVETDKTVQAVPAMTQLAMIQEQLKNFTAARDAYENVLSVAPNSALALNNLAVLYSEHLGQLDKAYELAQKAKEAVPNNPNIADTLGWIMFKKGDYGNALRLLQENSSKQDVPCSSSTSAWRITWWAMRGLPAPRCRRPSTRLQISRVRTKPASVLPCLQLISDRRMPVCRQNWKSTYVNGQTILRHWPGWQKFNSATKLWTRRSRRTRNCSPTTPIMHPLHVSSPCFTANFRQTAKKLMSSSRRPAKPIPTIRSLPRPLAFSTIGAGTTRNLYSC